jgi:putative hydrolase of the HAD superfamily
MRLVVTEENTARSRFRTRAVFLDAVGTLIHPEPEASRVYAEVGARFGSRYSAEDIARRFRAAYQSQEEIDRKAGWRTDEAREIERWRAIVGEVLDDVDDLSGCFVALYDHFRRPQSWACADGVAAVLDQLTRRGLDVGIASNFDERLRHVAEGLPQLQAARHLIISAEVGWRKPSPKFFAAIAEATRLPMESILFVGDDPKNDFDGARAAGMGALLIDPRAVYGEYPGIQRLGDLLSVQDL